MADLNARIDKLFKLKKTQNVVKQIYEKSQLCFPDDDLAYETVEQRLMLSCKTQFSQRHRAAPKKKGYDDLIAAASLLKKRFKENNIDLLVGRTLNEKRESLWASEVIDDILEQFELLKDESVDIIKTRVAKVKGETEEQRETARVGKQHLAEFIGAIFSTLDELGIGDKEALKTVKYFFKGLYPDEWKNFDTNRSTFVKTHCGLPVKKLNKHA